jgi:hypothetical protein
VVQELEPVTPDVLDVLERARVEVVDTENAVAVGEQVVAEVGAKKARPAGDDDGAHASG